MAFKKRPLRVVATCASPRRDRRSLTTSPPGPDVGTARFGTAPTVPHLASSLRTTSPNRALYHHRGPPPANQTLSSCAPRPQGIHRNSKPKNNMEYRRWKSAAGNLSTLATPGCCCTWGPNRSVRRCLLTGSRPRPGQVPQPRQAEIGLPRPLEYLRVAPLNSSVGRGKVFPGWADGSCFRSFFS